MDIQWPDRLNLVTLRNLYGVCENRDTEVAQQSRSEEDRLRLKRVAAILILRRAFLVTCNVFHPLSQLSPRKVISPYRRITSVLLLNPYSPASYHTQSISSDPLLAVEPSTNVS